MAKYSKKYISSLSLAEKPHIHKDPDGKWYYFCDTGRCEKAEIFCETRSNPDAIGCKVILVDKDNAAPKRGLKA